jgi:hypothetical protein
VRCRKALARLLVAVRLARRVPQFQQEIADPGAA